MSDSDQDSSTSGSEQEEEEEETTKKDSKKKESKKDKKKKDKKKDKKKKSSKRKRKHDSDDDEDDSKDKKRRKEEKKMLKKAKEFLRKKEEEEAELPSNVPYRMSVEHDYFKHLNEFRVYLRLIKNLPFETLSREDAHKRFEDFVKDWNRGKLPGMYYKGIPSDLQAECSKTVHKWGFLNKLSEKDKFDLESAASRVAKVTNKGGDGGGGSRTGGTARAAGGGGGGASKSREQEQLEREERREADKLKRKGIRDKEKVVMEELAPKATGREAKIENRKAKADTIHGASKAAEEARDGLALDESVTMGGGDDFESVKKRMMGRDERRTNARDRLVQEHQQKEQASMAKLLADLGIKPGDRITIAKRTT